MWKRKKLMTLHIKIILNKNIKILQNTANGLENTENAIVDLKGSRAILAGRTLLSWLSGQGSDGSVLVRLRQTHEAQLCPPLLSFNSVPVRTKLKPDVRMGRVVLVNGCILIRIHCLSPRVYELLTYAFHPTGCELLQLNTLAFPGSHCFSHVFFNLTHICNILGSDVIKNHQMVLLEMVLLILFKLTFLRPVPS